MMKSLRRTFLFSSTRQFGTRRDEEGFATAQWVVMMMATVLLLATLVQGLIVENVRATTLAALRESAREGTHVADFAKGGDAAKAEGEKACKERLDSALKDLSGVTTSSTKCTVKQQDEGPYYMEASIGNTLDSVKLVPWAIAFKPRLQNLNAVFVQTGSAQ